MLHYKPAAYRTDRVNISTQGKLSEIEEWYITYLPQAADFADALEGALKRDGVFESERAFCIRFTRAYNGSKIRRKPDF